MSKKHRLSALLKGVASVSKAEDCPILGVQTDSRAVQRGELFIAVPGIRVDGRRFIDQAVTQGAAAVAYEADGAMSRRLSVPSFAVAGLRHYVSVIADRFYDSPSRHIVIVGVTGTNGKTTCTQLLAQALNDPSGRCAVIGTLGYGLPDALNTSLHTTPDAITLQRTLAELARQHTRYVSMEVSSHALEQGRVNAVAFDVAVFTNLTRDHLDYHGDMERYGGAKAGLFDMPNLRAAVINADDAFGRALIERLRGRLPVFSFGLAGDNGTVVSPTPPGKTSLQHIAATHIDYGTEGLALTVEGAGTAVTIHSPLLGRFNASNLLAVFATLLALDVQPVDAALRLGRARPAAGRVERFGGDGNPLVVVDYAHTPDALEQVLTALRRHVHGRLYCVFGCGGDRDRGKRPEMGRIAERLADAVILTDDNPRHESSQQILDDILAGMETKPRVIPDRPAAIAAAIAEAGVGDVVLVAGKGHEDYQQVGDERRSYSDRDTVRALLGEAA